jgi:putative tryptophan/tyrosine transport system substrate-binding protein
MRRREFVRLLGGAAAWPLTARAQPASKIYRVGWLFGLTPLAEMMGPDPIEPYSRAFVHGLAALGYVEGKNLILERRSAEGKLDRIDGIAKELVERKPDVIVTGVGDFLAVALQRITRSVPIVAPHLDDPIRSGIAENIARPGGNVTGFLGYTDATFETKRLQLLKEAVPNAIRVAFLGTRDTWEGLVGQHVQDMALTLGITLIYVEHTPDDYTDAFALIARERPDALFLASGPANNVNRQRIADFALQQRIPSIFNNRDPVKAGALMSYGVSLTDLFRRAAGLVDKILRGANPTGIPIERPTKFELVINLKTAEAPSA